MSNPIHRFRDAPAGLFTYGLLSSHALQTTGTGIPWWVWLLLVLIILVIAIWWYMSRKPAEETYRTASPMAAPEPVASPAAPDDLAVIEGIGPKIAEILQGAGITTFAELAATETSRLEALMREANLRLADPSSWPEQARLAAAGDWDGLQSLQDRLKGGRQS
jgi:hypothetical protein